MTLRIDVMGDRAQGTLRLVGRMQHEHLGILEREIGSIGRLVALDLDELTLVDLEAVRFLRDAEAAGVELRHCPPYIRAWIEQEQDAGT